MTHGQIILVCLPGYLPSPWSLSLPAYPSGYLEICGPRRLAHFLAVSVSVLLFSVITFLINRLDDIPRSCRLSCGCSICFWQSASG